MIMEMTGIAGTDLQVSDICLGTGNFGASVQERDAFVLLDKYLAAGGNFLDTASVYCAWVTGDNSSEQFIGKWLKSRNAYHEMVIATKGGHYDLEDPQKISRITRQGLEEDLDLSLGTLGCDCIPLYYLHRDNEEKPVEEIMDICESFVKKGKIRYYAFSNWTRKRFNEAIRLAAKKGITGPVTLSNQYSLARRNNKIPSVDPTTVAFEAEDLTWLQETGITFIPYTSIAGGIFDKIHNNCDLIYDGKVHGAISDIPQAVQELYLTQENISCYEIMRSIHVNQGYSMLAISLAYLYGLDCALIPLLSVRTIRQLEEVLKASKVRLSAEEMRMLGKR